MAPNLSRIYQALNDNQPKNALKLIEESLKETPNDNSLKSLKCLALVKVYSPQSSIKNLETAISTVLPIIDSIIHQDPFPKLDFGTIIKQVLSTLKTLGECKFIDLICTHTCIIYII